MKRPFETSLSLSLSLKPAFWNCVYFFTCSRTSVSVVGTLTNQKEENQKNNTTNLMCYTK